MAALLTALGGILVFWYLRQRQNTTRPALIDKGVIVPVTLPTITYQENPEPTVSTTPTSAFKLANPQPINAGAPAFAMPANAPLGIRSNNPGNLRPETDKWKGAINQTCTAKAGCYLVFQSYEWGIRAIYRNLMTYRNNYGIKTVRGIITRWAPPKDNNMSGAYIASVAKALNVSPDTVLAPTQYPSLVKAIIKHENGIQPYTDAQIQFGINLP